jgi:hypothetical protein
MQLHMQRRKLIVVCFASTVPGVRYVQITAPPAGDAYLQISQLVVTEARTNINRARGKTCTASSYWRSGDNCASALDGVLAPRNYPPFGFHGLYANSDWFRVDLGAPFTIASVTYYNRADCCSHRIANARLLLLSSSGEVLAQQSFSTGAVQSFFFSPAPTDLFYEDSLGGGWMLVRRVKRGSNWHPARDDLKGYEAYGVYNSSTSDQTFSIYFANLVTPSTEFLFMTGEFLRSFLGCCPTVSGFITCLFRYHCSPLAKKSFSSCYFVLSLHICLSTRSLPLCRLVTGDKSRHAIMPFSSFNNNDATLVTAERPITASSANRCESLGLDFLLCYITLMLHSNGLYLERSQFNHKPRLACYHAVRSSIFIEVDCID